MQYKNNENIFLIKEFLKKKIKISEYCNLIYKFKSFYWKKNNEIKLVKS